MTDKKQKTIGVLTSGGDAPGMNAAIRAVVRSALTKGMKVYGIRRGYNGLLDGDMYDMGLRSVSEIIHRGGTILYTARSAEFNTPEGVQEARKMCERKGITGLVTIGGDGTFRGAKELCDVGVPCVAIPGTIDNDMSCSEYTIGFDTALNTAMQMVDKLRDTAMSHDRCSVVEVMGRHAGYMALNIGVACGALAIVVPEKPLDFEKEIVEKMFYTQSTGKRHFIIVVAEGCAGGANDIAKKITEATGIEARATILGHVQRGGSPTLRDRVVATEMGFRAVDLLEAGMNNRVIVMRNGVVTDIDINEAFSSTKQIDFTLLNNSEKISI